MPSTADLTRILAEHAPHIEAVVRRYADDPMDRDDLRQEIAIAVWRAMPRFAGRATERTYVLRIAHNRASTFCLRRARNRALTPGFAPDDQQAMSMSGEHERMHLADRLRDAMGRLPGMQRELLALAADGHSPAPSPLPRVIAWTTPRLSVVYTASAPTEGGTTLVAPEA